MKPYVPARLTSLLDMMGGVMDLTEELARAAMKRRDARKPRSGRNATLRPSAETPLWNAIVLLVKPHLNHRGARAILARELGVHRARIGEYFDTQTAMPDAERAFQILVWLDRRNKRPEK
tara:strand:- start:84 stop:443 length:360 start_codon:yes stop_codon:yes gene_type:complete